MDRVAVVTGAASGIGLACTKLLVERGAEAAPGRHDALHGTRTRRADRFNSVFVEADVSCRKKYRRSHGTVADRFGRLDILVNCAAIQIMGTLLETSCEQWDRLQGVNLRGIFLCSKAAMPYSQASGAGSIINIASVLGLVGDPAARSLRRDERRRHRTNQVNGTGLWPFRRSCELCLPW